MDHLLQPELIDQYYELKQESTATLNPINPGTFYDTISKYSNVIQIYIDGHAYICESTQYDPQKLIMTIEGAVHHHRIIKGHMKNALQDIYPIALKYADTEQDRQTIKTIVAEISSTKFAAQLPGIQNRTSIARAKSSLPHQLYLCEEIMWTSQVVRNDVTVEQRRRLTSSQRRGRFMKADEFPELGGVLEFAFGETDVRMLGGGELESHPRHTDGTLYKALDNNTTMMDARKLLLAPAPPHFTISLSSCYNYTQNFKAGTFQARRHHANSDIPVMLTYHYMPHLELVCQSS